MKIFSPEISLSLLILFLISQQLLYYFLFCTQVLNKRVTVMRTKAILTFLLLLVITTGCNSVEPPPDGNDADTTSHNFIFQTWSFGTIGGSTLYDCAIISTENIWCVGEIMIADTSINGYTTYNAVHWNGSQWELKRIPFTGSCSTVIYPAIRAIGVFSDSDIWFARAGSLVHFDGLTYFNDCRMNSLLTGSINKIWGNSTNNLYVVGNDGNIVRYSNGTWTRIESGTNLNINDIWGTLDNEGNQFILCTAYNFGTGGEKKLLQIRNFVVDEISWVDNRELFTVWFDSKYKIYAGGEGLFYRINNEWKEETLPALFKFKVRGNGINDVWTVGGYGFSAHYNGKSWKTFDEVSLASGNYLGLAVKENIVVMVGNEGNKSVITIGLR